MRKISATSTKSTYNRLFITGLLILFTFSAVAQTNVDSIKSALQTSNNDSVKVNLLNDLSYFYIQTNLDSVWHFAQSAKSISEKVQYRKGVADAFINIARYYQNKGSYEYAIQNCLSGLHQYEAVRAIAPSATANLLLAQISKDLSGQARTTTYINNGITHANISYKMFGSINDTAGIVNSLIMMGVLFRDKSIKVSNPVFFDTAFYLFTKALQLIRKTGKGKEHLAKIYNNISQVYIEHLKDYKTGLSYLFNAVAINQSNNNKLSLSFNFGNISNAYVQLHNYEKALKYAKLMLQFARQVQRPGRIHNALYQLYQVFQASHQPDSALVYYKLADNVNDSITDIAKTSQVMELQTKYETEKKEAQIHILNIEGTEKNRRITLLLTGLILLAFLSAAMILFYRRLQRQKLLITQQSKKLEIMMKELHHRVKNNLQIVSSLLSLQTYKLHDEAAITVLKESQQRVQAMSLIHQRLYKTDYFTGINMRAYVTDLAEMLLSAYGYHTDDFDLQLQIDTEILNVDKALPIGLIINEMITNAMKYAYSNVLFPVLKISLTENDNSLILIVKDNGNGIDEKAWKQETSSFGKQLITALGKQLRANQSLSVFNGTEFTIVIPKKEAA